MEGGYFETFWVLLKLAFLLPLQALSPAGLAASGAPLWLGASQLKGLPGTEEHLVTDPINDMIRTMYKVITPFFVE